MITIFDISKTRAQLRRLKIYKWEGMKKNKNILNKKNLTHII